MAAVTSDAQVANLALGLCGQRQTLDSLDEASEEARAAKTYFAQARDEVLAAWDWRQARKRAVLALSTETRDGWAYCYVAPPDMLTPRRIWQEDTSAAPVRFAWELNDAGDGHLILTDQADAVLVYTSTFTRVGLWRPRFTRAVYTQLAVYLAPMLPVKPELMPMLKQTLADEAMVQAKADDANAGVDEATTVTDFGAPWLDARGN